MKVFMNKRIKVVIGFVVLVNIILCGKTALSSEHVDNEAPHKDHEESGFELGLSVGYAYLKAEEDKAPVLHAHLMKRLSDEGLQKYFSLGFGIETILTDEKHYGAMVTMAVHPSENFIFSVSPGIAWEEHEGETKSSYATHLEAAYVFEASNYHIGPVVGYSKTKDDEHYTIGVHIGIPL